ncbi:MAG: redox-regulated ATPase YchF [Candidatus Altiarchaeales archaeon]|nr:MAG: redox-regulated ATPase YchF [Candidatus Altiarchaeales archaeon]
MEVGLVGKPNVGKSTFFKALTLKDVKISNFPFTTTQANIGVGYVKKECACKFFGVKCNPINSICIDGYRFIPVKILDVPGLVPDAHKGKGLGNKFLDELRRASALIHVLDISGKTNELGNPAVNHDPERDIEFLLKEIDAWFFQIVRRNLEKIKNKVKYEKANLVTELSNKLAGIGIKEATLLKVMKSLNIDSLDSLEDNLEKFSSKLRESKLPIILAANKADIDTYRNYDRLKERYEIIPTFAEGELALKQASAKGLIHYIPGESDFEIIGNLSKEQEMALEYIRGFMKKFGSTGVQECLDKAIFEKLDMIHVYTVENERKLSDSKGNILPDVHLMKNGSTALDLAYKIHTEIGRKFIAAIELREQVRVGRDYKLKDGDVIKIIAGR